MNTILNYISSAKQKSYDEYSAPCPSCGGDDRFVIWPNRANGGGFLCRKCEVSGNGITFLREFHNMTFFEACDALGIDSGTILQKLPQEPRKVWIPPSLWQENAKTLLRTFQDSIARIPDAKDFIMQRGITLKTALQSNLAYFPSGMMEKCTDWGLEPEEAKDEFYIPAGLIVGTERDGNILALNIRRTGDTQNNKHWYVKGGAWIPYCVGDIGKPLFIVESILDAILLWQEMENKVTAIALKGLTLKADGYAQKLIDNAPLILACPDNDNAGNEAWQEWRKILPKAIRVRPIGKDLGDMCQSAIQSKKIPSVRAWAEYCLTK